MCRDLYEVHEGEGCVLLAENERLRAELEEAHVARILAQNPGIDEDIVREHRRARRERAAR